MFLIRGRPETLYAARRQLTPSFSRCSAPPRCGGGANETVFGATDPRRLAVPPSRGFPAECGFGFQWPCPPAAAGEGWWSPPGCSSSNTKSLGAGLLMPKPFLLSPSRTAVKRFFRGILRFSAPAPWRTRILPSAGVCRPVRGVAAGTRGGPAERSYRTHRLAQLSARAAPAHLGRIMEMCLGGVAFVRSVITASAASGWGLTVTWSMSPTAGRAPCSAAFAEVTIVTAPLQMLDRPLPHCPTRSTTPTSPSTKHHNANTT